MSKRILAALSLAAFLALAGCDNDSGSISQPGSGGDDGGGDGGTDDGGSVNLQLGSGEGGDFQEGTLALGMDTISSGGSTGVSGRLLDADGEPASGSFEVTFTSTCVEDDQASINSPRTVVDGEFQTTYTAEGCSGSDNIVASVEVTDDGGTTETLTASATVQIEAGDLGSIAFVEADPENIGLKGMGGAGRTETSRVRFQARDATGAGIPDQTVNFSLSTSVGGIELTEDSATSDSDGVVATTIVAGTVPTPVRVNASVADTGIQTQSELVTISTGIPEDDGVSLSANCWNVEALGEDGITVELTMRLRDRFSNPVPDGTQVQFSSEGGLIEASCLTGDSACSVTWTSQNPRPADGRSSILAYLIGEESFNDVDGDGIYGQPEVDANTLRDVGEPFRDDTESGVFNPGDDRFFFDFDESGDRTGPNGVFDGVLCGINESDAFQDGFCGESHAPIGAQGLIIMSGSTAFVEVTDQNGNNMFDPTNQPFDVSAQGATLNIRVFDINDNPMACDTTVSVETDVGEILHESEAPIGGGINVGGNSQNFFFDSSDPSATESGRILIRVTTPSDSVTTFEPIPAEDSP